ncbi:MAG: hypothetical protein IIV09_01635 [Selenomonadaceae bacterium]|nr:hypothetical protein [Selenomonadaceae bacterium]MBQ5650276.1 hypothetical protein [Selenomonadaceae bacterium]
MATVDIKGLTINGAEVLVSWVNGFAKENLIHYQGDLRYWARLAKERSRERHSYILLNGHQTKDGKLHSLSFKAEGSSITFIDSKKTKQKKG